MERIRSLAIRHRHHIIPSSRRDMLLGFALNSSSKASAQVLIAYIPSALWKQQLFIRELPNCGVLYHITRHNAAIDPDTVERLLNRWPDTKAPDFSMSIFDIACYGQMGITSYSVGNQELLRLLELR